MIQPGLPIWFYVLKAIFAAAVAILVMYGMNEMFKSKWEPAIPKIPSKAEMAVAMAIFAYLFMVFYIL